MNKKHIRKLSSKIIWILLAVFTGVVMVVTAFGRVFLEGADYETRIGAMYLASVFELAAIFALFSCFVNRLLLKRIYALNQAVKEVAQGNYDLEISESGNDELSELAKNFNRMSRELKKNMLLSKNFTRYVSHEYKTPLSVVRSYAETVQLSSPDKEIRENMEVIISETDKMSRMTKNILELCKLDSTTIVERKDRISPAAQIRTVILALQIKWEEKKLEFALDLEEFEIESNKNLLQHIWQNLISNAVKFSEENGCIRISLKQEKDFWSFRIQNGGAIIGEEDLNRIYDLFFTGDVSHNKEGNGIGLTLTKEIIEKLGGQIQCFSETGQGTTFMVKMPL